MAPDSTATQPPAVGTTGGGAPAAVTVGRLYAASGAAWAVVAAIAATLLTLELALGLSFGTPWLGVGRLAALTRFSALLGGVSLPIAAHLASELPARRRSLASLRWTRWGLGAWNGGLLLGAIGILAGLMSPSSSSPAPWPSYALLLVGAALWAASLWSGASGCAPRPPVAAWFGLAAAVALLVYLGLGLLSAAGSTGAGQALTDALAGRGLVGVWAATAAMGVAAARFPVSARRPLYGRRSVAVGLWSWVVLRALAAPRDLAPELLPAWLADVAQAANALAAISAVFLAVALFGTFVGRERRPSAPPTDVGASEPGPSGVATMFVVAGLAVVLAQVLAQAAQGPISLRITQFTAWHQVAGLTPVLPGLTLVAIGAGYSLAAVPGAAYQVRPRVHFYTAVAAAILLITPLWAIGLAEAAIGPDGGIMRLRAAASAPGVALLLVSAAMWLLSMARALRRPAGDSPVSQPRESAAVRGSGGPAPAEPLRAPELARREPGTAAVVAPAGPGPSAPAVVGTAATLIVIALFVTLFLPLVDSGYSAATDRAGDRYLEPGSLAEQGRRIYVADGCAACHTQRVRPYPEDVVYGPVTEIGDFEYGPPLVGNRRAGPDLTWIGDRRVGREQMTEGLGAHGPDGVPAMPWLMSSEAATTRDGGIVVDYLMRLRSPTGPAPGADGS